MNQQVLAFHRRAGLGIDFINLTVKRGLDRRFHLHGLGYDQCLALLDFLTIFDHHVNDRPIKRHPDLTWIVRIGFWHADLGRGCVCLILDRQDQLLTVFGEQQVAVAVNVHVRNRIELKNLRATRPQIDVDLFAWAHSLIERIRVQDADLAILTIALDIIKINVWVQYIADDFFSGWLAFQLCSQFLGHLIKVNWLGQTAGTNRNRWVIL